MKKSHKREILMTRIIFAMFLLIVVLVIAIIIMVISSSVRSRNKENAAETETMQTEDDEDYGWGDSYDIYVPEETESVVIEDEPVVEVVEYRWTTTSVRFRSEPSTDSNDNILATLPEGTQVEWLSDAADGWAEVSYQDQVGYVSTDYLTAVDPNGADDGGEENPEDENE